ncbi:MULTISPECIES: MlaD family protein [unclassified Rhodococcus (in: high G+C Gram-positive bacteria)]|uniref:MlaD family protein n=1 Tax=unclassified Rhodococcus (in: high G+C Gram-positive bacteria) TaxID=192944 RepID=UPI00163AE5BB|nr:MULTISPECIES: MlaD family protein [unclassified Rhodococcus (in: high G+C Gram-positive bacteria)]MBC2639491.1 MCE family protein [Rhodococcus sp. 3A]MBC2895764.1 MCE family protein [Rhodococcus sp. 4CII]
MSNRTGFVVTLVKLAAAAAVSVLLFVIVISAMKSPVDGETRSYTAEFTDVSGLGAHGDIRTKGVRIGKVESVELIRDGGRSLAEVHFTMEKQYQLTSDTVLAVKYQNLTGVRYIDAEFPSDPGDAVDRLPADKTRPSYDITELFNGLQPVLATMSTDDINRFTENAISLLQGDGNGLSPMLADAQKLAGLAHDREQVISTLTGNLARISDSMGGRSPEVVEFLRSVSFPIAKAMSVIDEFPKTAAFGPEFLTPIKRLIDALGLQPGTDVEKMLSDAFESVPDTAEALRLLPVTFAGLQVPQTAVRGPDALRCTNGVAQLPTEVEVLLRGSEVVVCNP